MSTTPLPVVSARAARPAALQYIVIEGPIGAGKTTLATRLAERWSMQTLFESNADNPPGPARPACSEVSRGLLNEVWPRTCRLNWA